MNMFSHKTSKGRILSCLLFIASYCCVSELRSQNYYQNLDNLIGYPHPALSPSLDSSAQRLNEALPDEFKDKFKVFGSAYYHHTPSTSGGTEASLPVILSTAKSLSPFNLLFVKESNETGIITSIKVFLELPESGIFNCLTAQQRAEVKTYIQEATQLKYAESGNTYSSYADAEIAGINKLIKIIESLKKCCTTPTTCDICPDQEQALQLKTYFESHCFIRIPIEVDTNKYPAKPGVQQKIASIEVQNLSSLTFRFSNTSEYGNLGDALQNLFNTDYFQNQGLVRGIITDNKTFCPDGKFDEIKASYQESTVKTGLWAHIWNDPESTSSQSYLYINAHTNDRSDLCDGPSQPDVLGELALALEVSPTTHGNYNSKFEQCATTVLFTAAGTCYGDKVVVDYVRKKMDEVINQNYCSPLLDEQAYFLSPANHPLKLPHGAIPYFVYSIVDKDDKVIADNRSLFAFFDGNGRFKACKYTGSNVFAGYYDIQQDVYRYNAQAGNASSYVVFLGHNKESIMTMEANLYTPPANHPPTTYADGLMSKDFFGIGPSSTEKHYIWYPELSMFDTETFDLALREALISPKRYGGTLVRVPYGTSGQYKFYLCKYEESLNKNIWYKLVCDKAVLWEEVNISNEQYPGFILVGTIMIELREGAFKDWLKLHGHEILDVISALPVAGTVADLANGIWYLAEGDGDIATLCFIGAALNCVISIHADIIKINNGADPVRTLFNTPGWAPGLTSSLEKSEDAVIDLYKIKEKARTFELPDDKIADLLTELKNVGDKGKLLNEFTKNPDLVGAYDVLNNSSNSSIRDLRTDYTTLSHFVDNFGSDVSVLNKLKNNSSLLETWYEDGIVLHRTYPGAGNWPTIQIDDDFKYNVRATWGNDIGDLIDAVDGQPITNNEQVRAGVYHPALIDPSSSFITEVNFLPSEKLNGKMQEFLDNIHPILKKRIEYLEFLRDNNLLNAPAQSITNAGVFGSHAEFRALDKAIKKLELQEGMPPGAFPEARLNEFTLFVKARQGTNPPRCVCCWHGTHGVKIVGNE